MNVLTVNLETKRRLIKKMPKAIFVPPALNTAEIPTDGARVTVTDVRIMRDQMTAIGNTKYGIGLDIEYKKTKYSQMFSLDKAILTGSIGRILVTIGAADTEAPDFEAKVKTMKDMQFTVMKRGGKIYWYP